MKITALLSLLVLAPAIPAIAQTSELGTTRIAQWRDDKKASFLLMFDDGWPSGWQVAVPEMKKRGMIGTFYICPAKGEFKKFEAKWKGEVLEAGMVLANHTMTHNGLQSLEDAEWEFGDCTKYILDAVPGKKPRLISFGKPGVDTWKISQEEYDGLLKKNFLINRPDFRDHGANYHVKTVEQMLGLADKAIAKGGTEYLVFHGLERITPNWAYQDMWAVKQDVLLPFLDGLAERRDRGDLWITDHISAHKYETERTTAKVEVKEKSAKRIQLIAKNDADTELYDEPLTFITNVPPTWKACKIQQGETKTEAAVKDGRVQFEALPNGVVITLEPKA